MSILKSKFRTFKISLNIALLAALVVVLVQNVQLIDVEILFWEAHISLSVLLLGTAILGASIVFIAVLLFGRN
ncbi:MAG: lipopolysaccharide assembly protein LapA domain-containing protein [Bacteroidota bacterium]